jgi:hypothetical protein
MNFSTSYSTGVTYVAGINCRSLGINDIRSTSVVAYCAVDREFDAKNIIQNQEIT